MIALTSAVQLLKHPGPIVAARRDVLAGRDQKTYRIALRAGETLYASVVRALNALGIRAAALSIKSAAFSRLSYYLIASSPDVEPVAHYTTPLTLSEPCMLIGSGATIGVTQDGEYAIHCHGLAVTESGVLTGGHFLTDACVLAEDAVAYINALNHMDLRIGIDPEIKTPVFQPSYVKADRNACN
jgi:predicted DNA-binding protein with PD1-like motif